MESQSTLLIETTMLVLKFQLVILMNLNHLKK